MEVKCFTWHWNFAPIGKRDMRVFPAGKLGHQSCRLGSRHAEGRGRDGAGGCRGVIWDNEGWWTRGWGKGQMIRGRDGSRVVNLPNRYSLSKCQDLCGSSL